MEEKGWTVEDNGNKLSAHLAGGGSMHIVFSVEDGEEVEIKFDDSVVFKGKETDPDLDSKGEIWIPFKANTQLNITGPYLILYHFDLTCRGKIFLFLYYCYT